MSQSREEMRVNYHVSDFLKDRHPYNFQTGFGTQRQRDQGKVMNGMLPGGLDRLIESINDQSLEPMQKAAALKHLFAHSAAAEKKIVLLRKGIVPMLSANILAKPIPIVEQLCAQLLRSLCILPQGSHCVVMEGGLAALCAILSDRRDQQDREEARVHAASAIQQLVSNWDGRAWLLGIDVPDGLQLLGRDVAKPPSQQTESLAQAVCDVLVSIIEKDRACTRMLYYTVHALALITSVSQGLQLCLIAGAMRAASTVLEHYSQDDTWVYKEQGALDADIVQHAVMIVWHMSLDDLGKKEAAELQLSPFFGKLISFVLPAKEKHIALKSSLAGGVCALAMHPPMKTEAVALLPNLREPACLLDLILRLLRQVNDLYEPLFEARKQNKPISESETRFEELQGCIKNCVQAIRLVCELPKAREHMHEAVPPQDYIFRRQIFYMTAWMEDFGVKPV